VTSGWTAPTGGPPDDGQPPRNYAAAGWSTAAPPRPTWGEAAPPTPPRPGVVPLRPLAVGELLDGAFTTIRRYPGPTIGLAAPVMLLVTGTQVVASYLLLNGVSSVSASGTASGDFVSRSITVDIIVQVMTFVFGLLLTGMITAVIGQAVLGRRMNVSAAWQSVRPRLAPLAGVALIIFLGSIVIMVIGVGPGILIAVAGPDAAGVGLAALGGLGGFVVLIWLLVRFELATPAVMLEKQGVRESFRRSSLLVAGSWWRVFGILALATLLSGIVAGILVVPFTIAANGTSGLFGHGYTVHFTGLLLVGIGNFLAGTIVRPFSASVSALLYIDRRMRSEGLDLTLQQAAADDQW
jgi:hypothetical protein